MMKICILLASCLFINVVSANYMRICRVFRLMSSPTPPEVDFDVGDIDPFLCTHLIKDRLFLVTEDDSNNVIIGGYDMDYLQGLFRPAKTKNPDLKIIASVSVRDPLKKLRSDDVRMRIIEKTILFLRQHDFDGLDLGQYYWNENIGNDRIDERIFILLCRDFYKAFEKESLRTRRTKLTLSATVSIKNFKNYGLPETAKYLEFLHVESFNFYKKGTTITSHHAAMADDGVPVRHRRQFTVPFLVDYLIQLGIPPYKMTLGLATFGRTFELKNGSVHGLGAPTTGNGGEAGPYTKERGVLSYPEICKIKRELTFVDSEYRNKVKASYAYSSSKKLWIAFDDAKSLVYKIRTQIKAKGLAGACIQNMNLDDATGKVCGEGKNPLITAIKDELGYYSPKKSC